MTRLGVKGVIEKTLEAGSRVTIKNGAVYGGLTVSRGALVPDYISGPSRRYTVAEITTHHGVQEARIAELESWVALDALVVV